MVPSFIHTALPARVVFGAGALARLADELAQLGITRAMVLTTPQRRRGEAVVAALGAKAAGLFAEATMHTPVEVTERALAAVTEHSADGLVAIGGGSTIGLAKAVALRTDLPQVAIPTTYAGSEMTPILGETRDRRKTTQRSLKVLPETVIYDPDLTLTLPAGTSVTSGMNAIAHAAEALYARDRSPLLAMMAKEGIATLAQSLPRIVADGRDAAARADALYGAWLCGTCLAMAGMALHHKLCHVLGGMLNLPHAETHTIVLPHAIAYNSAAAPDAMAAIASALHAAEAPRGLYDLAGRLGAPRALRDLGMKEADIDAAADAAVRDPYWNPRPVEREPVRDLIARAWAGDPPLASV